MLVSTNMHAVRTPDLSVEYPEVLDFVKRWGQVVPSRIGETTELLNFMLIIDNPMKCIVKRDGMSEAFMNEEITQILAGRYDFDRLHTIVPRAAELITEATAYGPRTWEQLHRVATELEDSPTSRRAVVYIGRPMDLVYADTDVTAGEMPCTMTWQFHLRDDELHMTVNMRSWDLVWGLSYDVPSFVAVQMAMAEHLDASVGTYTHLAGSGHIYDRHYNINVEPNPEAELDLDWLLGGSIPATRENALKIMGVTEEVL